MPKDLFFTIDKAKKNRIVEAAIKEFSSHLYGKASINQIIKEADISRGSFYQYFEDIEDLYAYTIKSVVDSTAYSFLKDFLATTPEDIFSVYKALFTYNLRLISDEKYQAFFRNMYLGINYRLQQELRAIFGSIRNEMFKGSLDELGARLGYKAAYFQELMNLLELNNRDLLMLCISSSIDESKIMEIYDIRVQVLKGRLV